MIGIIDAQEGRFDSNCVVDVIYIIFAAPAPLNQPLFPQETGGSTCQAQPESAAAAVRSKTQRALPI